jgi:hypothetical protein
MAFTCLEGLNLIQPDWSVRSRVEPEKGVIPMICEFNIDLMVTI